jgi:hypothetical protein
MADMEIVIETLEEIVESAYRDMKANQGIGDDPGGHWSTRTEAAILRARALIASLKSESVDAARDGAEAVTGRSEHQSAGRDSVLDDLIGVVRAFQTNPSHAASQRDEIEEVIRRARSLKQEGGGR